MLLNERKLRIVTVCTTLNIGSEGYTSYDFIKGLSENGAEIYVITNKVGDGVDKSLFKKLIELDLNPRKKKGWKIIFSIMSDALAVLISKVYGCSVIHGDIGNHLFLSSIISKKLYTWGPTLRISDPQTFGDENDIFYGLPPTKYKSHKNFSNSITINQYSSTKRFLFRFFKKLDLFIISNLSLIVAGNKVTADFYSTLNKAVVAIPECVDTSFFSYSKPPDSNTIFTSGVMLFKEGHETAIRAFNEVIKRFPDSRLIVLGDGPRMGYLKNLAKELKLCHLIDFRGYVSRDQVKSCIRSSKVILLPAMVEEGGISTKEAMASGRPVVASNVLGHKNDIVDQVEGFLVPPTDYLAYANRVIDLFNSSELLLKMSANSRKKAEIFFDYRITSRKYINEVYKIRK